MQSLQPGSVLQGGKYKILSTLGQGGFGITYLAENTMLNGTVAIKEFFFKDYCYRDGSTNHVTVPTEGNRELVDRYRQKFIKEARTIFKLKHPHVVSIFDIFEENGTAYYVMDYCEGGSLDNKLKDLGRMSEPQATRYILQVADALGYIHGCKVSHLDVKPANVMLNKRGEAVLIDFGLSKQYDAAGNQTSSTPVGISEGYAPMEQYKQSGVGEFSPQTDIYALGATFFKLLTGATPPSASDVNEDGVPVDVLKSAGVSQAAIDVICKAMEPRKRDRMKTVTEFIDGLKSAPAPAIKEKSAPVADAPTKPMPPAPQPKSEEAKRDKPLPDQPKKAPQPTPEPPKSTSRNKRRLYWIIAAAAVVIVAAGVLIKNNLGAINITPINDTTITVNGVQFTMKGVEGGTFMMGASDDDSDTFKGENPAHKVTLSSYRIGETEVTQELWLAVMGSNPSEFTDDMQRPVDNVSWDDCQEFIKKLNEMTGKHFRLPTEAEWEYAASGGNKSQGYKYAGSNDIDEVAWYIENVCGVGESSSDYRTHRVAQKKPNELGLYDMSGNLYEWCQDWYGEYSSGSQTNPTGPETGSYRVLRGGSWYNYAMDCRMLLRDHFTPSNRYCILGFRLAL